MFLVVFLGRLSVTGGYLTLTFCNHERVEFVYLAA
jgi:hypothetical protein